MIRVFESRSFEEIQTLAPDWRKLLEESATATPFQSPDWILPWWKNFGSGELLFLWLTCEGRLSCIAPLFVHKWKGRRQVTLAGTGVSDHQDFVTDAAVAERCVSCCLRRMESLDGLWDVCDWQDLPNDSPVLQAVDEMAIRSEVIKDTPCGLVTLPDSIEDFRAGLPHGLRRNLRRYREHLEKAGKVELVTAAGDPDGKMIESLIRLHHDRWRPKGGKGMLDGEPKRRFFQEATAGLAAHGQVRFHSLVLNDETIAIAYVLHDRTRAYGYLSGFAPEYGAYSPGSLVLAHAMEHAIEQGLRFWDFLRGEEKYKLNWGTTLVPQYRVRITAEGASKQLSHV